MVLTSTKKRRLDQVAAFLFQSYEAGGTSSAAAGFFLSVKKPTPTGIKIKINERQSRTNPTVGDKFELLNVPFPTAVSAPNKQIKSPGQPQSTTAATVAIIPVFLLFILSLLWFEFRAVYTVAKREASFFASRLY
jgi:hypothetical protein